MYIVISIKIFKLIQLSGLSDPIYAEAITVMKSFEFVLDILVVNRTPDVLQNVTFEITSSNNTNSNTNSNGNFIIYF